MAGGACVVDDGAERVGDVAVDVAVACHAPDRVGGDDGAVGVGVERPTARPHCRLARPGCRLARTGIGSVGTQIVGVGTQIVGVVGTGIVAGGSGVGSVGTGIVTSGSGVSLWIGGSGFGVGSEIVVGFGVGSGIVGGSGVTVGA